MPRVRVNNRGLRIAARRQESSAGDGVALRSAAHPSLEENSLAKLRHLEQKIAIDRHELEQVCVEHPDLLYQVSTEVVLLRSIRDENKKELDEQEAGIYVRLRRDAEISGERITEAELKARITLDRQHRELMERVALGNSLLARWETLRDAFNQRSFMIRELVQLYLARYYGDPARNAEARMRDLGNERYQAARREQTVRDRNR